MPEQRVTIPQPHGKPAFVGIKRIKGKSPQRTRRNAEAEKGNEGAETRLGLSAAQQSAPKTRKLATDEEDGPSAGNPEEF
jgi:hypothetical protein